MILISLKLQELLKTNDRKNLIYSLNILNKNELIKKFKNEGKTLYKVTDLGRELWRELETIIINGE